MSERKAGWYWVKSPEDYWLAASYEPYYQLPWLIGDCRSTDNHWQEIGPRIPTPDEPWQCVPKSPNDAMCEAGKGSLSATLFGIRAAYVRMLRTAPKPEDA